MSKKQISLLLFLLCLISCVWIAFSDLGQKQLSELYVDDHTWEQLLSSREASSPAPQADHALLDAVYMNGYALPFDQESGMFLYSLIEDSVPAYDPPVKLHAKAPGTRIAFRGNPISGDLIRDNEAIDMLVYTDTHYSLYQLKCTTLPVIRIDAPASGVGDASVSTRFTLFDNRAAVLSRIVSSEADIHIRGNNSRFYPKKDYRIALRTRSAGNNVRNHHVSLLGLRQDDDWILKSQYNDRDKIREVFSAHLWYASSADNNEFGIVNGLQYRYVEVFMGQEYAGIYALTNPIDAKQVALKDSEYFYKKIDTTSEADIDFFATGAVPGYEFLNREPGDADWEPLREYYRTLFGYTTREEQIRLLRDAVDVGNSIDLFLFLNLIQGVDHAHIRGWNAIYNLFFTFKATEDGRLKLLYTPWDMDRTWGFTFGDEYEMDSSLNVVMDTNIVPLLLELGDKETLYRLKDRYDELRAGIWSDENIEKMLLALEEDIFASGAYDRDYEKWYVDAALKFPEEEYEGYVREYEHSGDLYAFIEYVLDRLWYMDDYVDELLYIWDV